MRAKVQLKDGELEHKPEVVEAWVSELCRRFGHGPIAVPVDQVKGALVYMQHYRCGHSLLRAITTATWSDVSAFGNHEPAAYGATMQAVRPNMTVEERLAIVEKRMMACCEIQGHMITILDVLEVGQIAKAEVAARQARELAHALLDDLGSDRQRLESAS